MLLYCNEPNSPVRAIQSLSKAMSDRKIDQEVVFKNYKIITDIKKKKLKQPIEPFSLDKAKQFIGCQEHKDFAEAVAQRKLVETNNK